MRHSVRLFAAAFLCVGLADSAIHAQQPAPAVGIGFGVDTTIREVRNIVALTRAYLLAPDSTARSRGLWSTRTPLDAHFGDIATNVYQGFNATIASVTPADPGDSIYIVKILHASRSTSGKPVSPIALQRVLAVRASGSPFGWQLANALPFVTREWAHLTSGRVTFWYAPGQRQSVQRARVASTFVDSVARLFGTRPPDHIDAYVAASTDEAWRAIGVDYFPDGSGPDTGFGGRTLTRPRIVLIGDPRVGEAYLHEFVHATLAGELVGGTGAFNEGVATWLGGSDGHSARELYAWLQKYQQANPTVTISQLLNGEAEGTAEMNHATYATNALIVESIFRQSGVTGLREFAKLQGSSDEMLRALPRFIKRIKDSGTVDDWWREAAKDLARR